jgi:hypothetical protein
LAYWLISAPAQWRLDHDFYWFPFEVWLKRYVDKLPAAPEEPPVEKTPSEAMAC